MSKYKCPHCSNPEPIPAFLGECPACNTSVQAPNVRAANKPEEEKALSKRVSDAEFEAKARGAIEQLDDFCASVKEASAVVCCQIGKIKAMIEDNSLYTNFYKQLDGGSRLPEENGFDQDRVTADSLVFPNYHEEIVFAALTLNNLGAFSYGGGAIVLKEDAIAHRSSVFEENTLVFCTKHTLGLGKPVPHGFKIKLGAQTRTS